MVSQRGFLLLQQMIALALAALFIALFGGIVLQLWQAFRWHSQLVALHQQAIQLQVLFQREFVNGQFWAGLVPQQIAVPDDWQVDADCRGADDSGSFPRVGLRYRDLLAGRVGDADSPACLRNAVAVSGYLQIKRLAAATTIPSNRIGIRQQAYRADFVRAGAVQPDSWYWPYLHEVYYVARQGTVPTLMRKRLLLNAQQDAVMDTDAVLDGVEQLEFELGLDTDADALPDQFSHSADAGQAPVVMIRYWALLRSVTPQQGYQNNQIYQMGSRQWQAPGDAFQRVLISSSVRLLNGVPR
jgi:type IV pilus assembly protein PilW